MRIHYDIGDRVAGLGAYQGETFTVTAALPHGAYAQDSTGLRHFVGYHDIEAAPDTKLAARYSSGDTKIEAFMTQVERLTDEQLALCRETVDRMIQQNQSQYRQTSKEWVGEL